MELRKSRRLIAGLVVAAVPMLAVTHASAHGPTRQKVTEKVEIKMHGAASGDKAK